MNQSSGAGWRKQKGASNAGRSRGSWEERSPNLRQNNVFRQRLKLFVLLSASCGLIGALIYTLLQTALTVPMLAVAVTSFDSTLPPNALAWEDVNRLDATLASYDNVKLTTELQPPASKIEFLNYVESYLREVEPGGPDRDLVMLYISAHGVVDEQGRACLLLGESNPLDSATWLPLEELFSVFDRVDRLQSVQKLVFLDANRIRRNWMLGQTYNSFAEQISAAMESSGIEKLAVINSTSPGQVGQISLAQGGSVFGFAVADALRGAVAPDTRKFDVKKLVSYLQTTVGGMAYGVNAEQQIPMLLPNDCDFPVAYVAGYESPETAAVNADKHLQEMNPLWSQHQEWLQRSVFTSQPIAWARLEHLLVRLDQLSIAGQAYSTQFDQALTLANELLREFESSNLVSAYDGSTLALANALEPLSESEMTIASNRWDAFQAKKTSQPEDSSVVPTDATGDTTQAQAEPSLSEPETPLPYRPAATLVLSKLRSGELAPSDLPDAFEFLDTAVQAPQVDYSEIQFLRIAELWCNSTAASQLGTVVSATHVANHIAIPADVRTQYWIRTWLDQIEKNVRHTQDLVLVGSQITLQKADEEWKALFGASAGSGDFHDLQQFSELVSDAYYWRDRSWSVMPHLLFWATSETVFQRDAGLVDRIHRLADSTFELSTLLDSAPDAIPTASIRAEMETKRNDVANVLRELERTFGNRVSELERSGAVRDSLAEIALVLETPLVTGPTRSGLMRKFVGHQSQSAPEESPGVNESDDAYVEWLVGKPNSALLRLLSVAAVDQQNPSSRQMQSGQLAKIGGQIRNRIASIGQTVQSSIVETEDHLANSNLPIAQSRSGLSQADQMIRPVASISARHPWSESASNPGYDLHRMDVFAWLLWHGERSLSDFYASTAMFDTPFFVESVRQHLSASLTARPGKSAHRELLRNRLEEAEASLLSWKPIETTDSEKLPGEPFLHHQIKFLGNALFPPGDVALFTRAADTEIRVEEETSDQPATRMVRNVHESTVAEQTLLDVVTSSEFEVVALFRGHVRKVPFYGQEVKGPIVRFLNEPTLSARVRVKGDQKEVTQLVFVLDCSGSMKTNGRMNKAKRVLESVLGSLEVDVAPFRVSLVAYGHRSHWEKSGDKMYIPAASPYFREFSRGALPLPGDDVQLVYESPARFGNDERRDLLQVIDQLDHFGETPLYFAVQQAVQALEDRDGPKHVIVITDGDPDVFGRATPPRENKLLSASSFNQQVLQPLANADSSINLNFVFFQFGGGEVGQLVQGRPGIKTFVANQEQELQSAILESLRISQFYVRDVEKSQPEKRIQLNQYWDEPNIQVEGRVFQVVLDGAAGAKPATVKLFGGDRLELFYNTRANRLEHERFTTNLRQQVPDLRYKESLGRNEAYFVAAHVPEIEGRQNVTFVVSVQNNSAFDYSERPRYIWAEIRPIYTPGGTPGDPVFYAFDAHFQINQPVPVLRFPTGNWPSQAEWAEIRLYFSTFDQDVDAVTKRIGLADKSNHTLFEDVQLKFEPRRDASGAFELVVNEEHARDSEHFPLWLQFDPQPARISHQFLASGTRVRHILGFTPESIQGREIIQLKAAAKATLVKNWIEVKPLIVEIPKR